MAITKADILAYNPSFTDADWAKVSQDYDGLGFRFVVTRHNPDFSLHGGDPLRTQSYLFDAAKSNTIVRVTNNAGTLEIDKLPEESTVTYAALDWVRITTVSGAMATVNPVIEYNYPDGWNIYYVDTSNLIHQLHSNDVYPTSFTEVTRYDNTSVFTDIIMIAATQGHVYALQSRMGDNPVGSGFSGHVYALWCCYLTTAPVQTSLVLSEPPDSIAVTWYADEQVDSRRNPYASVDSNAVRHCLAMCTPFPSSMLYRTNPDGTPYRTEQKAGGIVTFIITPLGVHGATQPIVSDEFIVEGFDKVTTIRYRKTVHITRTFGSYPTAPSTNNSLQDTLVIVTTGQDGDENGSDFSYSYPALYYYTSRDGRFWSQSRVVPLPTGSVLDNWTYGAKIIDVSTYLYLVGSFKSGFSKITTEFGRAHPDYSFDLTPYIESINSSFSDIKQSSFTVMNSQNVISNSLVGQAGVLELATYLRLTSNHTYILLSVEDIDSINPVQERPDEMLTITTRNRMAWPSDRVEAIDTFMFDNQIVGRDTFDEINTQVSANSGMSHTAGVDGSFATSGSRLKVTSDRKKALAWNTFDTNIANGFIAAGGRFGDTVADGHDVASQYLGVAFRGIDKDNYWFVRIKRSTQAVQIGYVVGAVEYVVHSSLIDSGTILWNIINSNLQDIYIGADFNHASVSALVGLWTGDAVNNRLWPSVYGPVYISKFLDGTKQLPLMGYVGVTALGYSTEDSNTTPIDPGTILPPIIDPYPPGGDTIITPTSTTVPTKIVVLASDQVYRAQSLVLTGGTTTPVWESCGLTPVGDCISIVADPWSYKRYIVLTTTHIYICNDLWAATPTWTSYTCHFPAGTYSGFNISNISGSVNRNGYFCWMSVVDTPFVDPGYWGTCAYFNYTTDYFATTHTTVYCGDIRGGTKVFSIQVGCHNRLTSGSGGPAIGNVYIGGVAGIVPGGTLPGGPWKNMAIKKSDNWGASWTQESINGMDYGQYASNISIPFMLTSTIANSADAQVSIIGVDVPSAGPTGYFNMDGSTPRLIGSASGNDNAMSNWDRSEAINYFTLDGRRVAVMTADHGAFVSDNTGGSWTAYSLTRRIISGSQPHAHGINGFPTNYNFFVAWMQFNIYVTTDMFTTTQDLWPSLASYTGTNPAVRVVMADLSSFYSTPVI